MTQDINLFPTSRQFPFDQTCDLIVRTLQARQWRVKGIDVEFDEYGRGYRMVQKITGPNFILWFCRIQRCIDGHWNDTAGISEIIIPRRQLSVFSDDSGPSYYYYVGNDWGRDKHDFMRGAKVHSRMDKRPKIYLAYTGGWVRPSDLGLQYTYSNRRAPFLVHTNDCGREYDPAGDEPRYFVTEEVFYEITKWLVDNVLNGLLGQNFALKDVSPYHSGQEFEEPASEILTPEDFWSQAKRQPRPADPLETITAELGRILQKRKVYDHPYVLKGIYKQLALSKKGRQTHGPFRKFMEDHPIKGLEFLRQFTDILSSYGLANHARRLRAQYRYDINKFSLHKLIRESGLSTRPEFYSGRGATLSDLNSEILEKIFLGIKRALGPIIAKNYVRMVENIQVLSATEFLLTLYRLERNGWKWEERLLGDQKGEYYTDAATAFATLAHAMFPSGKDDSRHIRDRFLWKYGSHENQNHDYLLREALYG